MVAEIVGSLVGLLVAWILVWVRNKLSPKINILESVDTTALITRVVKQVENIAKAQAVKLSSHEKLSTAISIIDALGASTGLDKISEAKLSEIINKVLSSDLTPDEMTPKAVVAQEETKVIENGKS
jgi:hypothetical protein